ncbi:MAG: M1 family metallopeptidase [Deltaproteobacteria bacterium]|nr:M1 family metallopeptidase [Deltaproteobacteria bacterium]
MATKDPHSYTDTSQGRVAKVELDLAVDFENRQLKGSATLTFAAKVGGPLDLDSRALTIDGVKDDRGAAVAFESGTPDPVLGTRLRLQLAAPTTKVTVHYATSPSASALQWLEPQHTAGGKAPYLFSQCQPHHARSLLPLQDSPMVRFAYQARLTVPAGLVAVMSAAPGKKEAGGSDQTVAYRFDMPQPIPGYLLALAVGNIASQDLGPRSRVYAEPETLGAAAREFAGVNEMLLAAEKLFGPYRWERYDFLVMPPAFPYGGMENPRLTFLTPTLIAGDKSLVNVLAHELAHSWTGNLVTNATMNDFWLNEGFTVWAERRIHEALQGEEALALAAAIGRDSLNADLERFGMTSPFTKLKTDLAGIDPDDVYSQVPYEKGFLFVALLEATVGRKKIDAFVRAYTDRFAFTSITTEEFLTFMDEALPGVAQKIGARDWVYEPGIPANAPAFSSKRLEELQALAAAWATGARPDPKAAKQWSVDEWLVYLGALPKKVGEDDCRWLDQTFHFNDSGNAEILCKWLVMAARANYTPAFAKLAAFLGHVGRMKFLKPIYKALAEGQQTRALAKEIFAANKDRYHPIARGGLEKQLSG